MQVQLGILKLQCNFFRVVDKRPRMSGDGSTYVWTDFVIDCVSQLNPSQTSYTLPAAAVPDPVADAVSFGAVTDAAIYEYLGRPQLPLTILDDAGNVWLQAPIGIPGVSVDQNLGPKLSNIHVEQISGDRTWQVSFRIEAAVNNYNLPNAQHILLSQRWTRYASYDQEHYQTIVTEGECIFNLTKMIQNQQYCDQFRRELFHPVPPFFKREQIDVMPQSDGFTYYYRVVDREQPYSLGADCPATRIECTTTRWYSQSSATEQIATSVTNYAAGLTADPVADAGKLVHGVSALAVALLPKYYFTVQARAWGNRVHTNDQLRNVCLGIVSTKLATASALTVTGTSDEFILIQDEVSRYVEVQKTVRWGPQALAKPAAGFLKTLTFGLSEFVFGSPAANIPPQGAAGISNPQAAILGTAAGQNTLSTGGPDGTFPLPQGQQQNPNFALGAFGTTTVALIQQVLANPGSLPARPPAAAATIIRNLY